jgi:hypothetical protein
LCGINDAEELRADDAGERAEQVEVIPFEDGAERGSENDEAFVFVIPAALPDVAVIVDISTLPKIIDAKSALAELGRISWASPQGNIPVKPAPIRLSALCTAF